MYNEKIIINIQKKYKLKRLERVIASFKKLHLYNYVKESDFNKFTKIISHKSVLEITYILLKRINRIYELKDVYKIQNRIFLSAYLISAFPDIILSPLKNKLEENLYNIALNLVNYTRILCDNININNINLSNLYIHKFKNIFNEYGMLFAVWQHIDKEGIIDMLAIRYDSLKRTIKFINEESKFDDYTKRECIDTLTRQFNDIEKKVKLIDKNFNIDHFIQYSELREKIEYNFNKVFWDKMSQDIKKDNYDGVIQHIKELIKNICNLIPNRKDIHREIEDKIDIEIIEQLIENRMFNGKTLFEYTGYIFDWLVKLSSKSREDDLKKSWDDLIIEYSNNEYHILVPKIFQLLYKILGLIDNDLVFS